MACYRTTNNAAKAFHVLALRKTYTLRWQAQLPPPPNHPQTAQPRGPTHQLVQQQQLQV
jgi:hypothetical protein